MRGWLARAIKYLGGNTDNDYLIPDVYAGGLTDYQAHLQMIGIWQWGITDGALLPIMVDRIKEHAGRSPDTLFYQYMLAKHVTGNYDDLVDNLLTDPESAGEYVRCGGSTSCQLSEKLWITKMIIKDVQ
jgi:hypothetical protein